MKVVKLSDLQESVESLVQTALEKTAAISATSGPSATSTGSGKPVIFQGRISPWFSGVTGHPVGVPVKPSCPLHAEYSCCLNLVSEFGGPTSKKWHRRHG